MDNAKVVIKEEVWRDIPGFEGKYQASSIGRIKNLERYVGGRYGKTRKIKEKIRALQNQANGYESISLGVGVILLVHRAVAMAHIPNPEGKPFVNHKDGNKKNNRLENLEWVTRQENEDHANATGLKDNSGIKCMQAKLNDDLVRQIRLMYKPYRTTYSALAEKFGVHYSTIKKIIKQKTWDHVL